MDTIEKVYCTGHENNDALLATLANRNNNDPMAMAAMMNNSQWMNNPFIYLVFLMMFGRNGLWGNNGNGLQDAEIQSKLNQISTQMQDGNNTGLLMDAVKGNNTAIGQLASNLNCDFNALNNAICNVRSGIQEVAGNIDSSAEKVINAITLGDANLTSALQTCCCQTQQNIIKMGYENQIATLNQTNELKNSIQYVATGVERGFSALGFQNAQDKCDIIRSAQDNTQRIIDTLNVHWQADLQQRYNDARLELSQQRQNAELIAALKTSTTTTTA